MEKFVDKLSEYEVLNNLLPGAIYCFMVDWFWEIQIGNSNWIQNLFVYYFFGLIISRIGSLVVEPFLLKIKCVKFEAYSSYCNACKKNPRIQTLSCMNNVFRSMVALIMVVCLTYLYKTITENFGWIADMKAGIVLVLLFIIFVMSYRKQTAYISNCVRQVLEDE